MADAVLSVVLESLAESLLKESRERLETYNVAALKDKMTEIRLELITMKGYLKAADARQSKEARVRQWVRELKALVYRIEDVIDIFNIHFKSRNEMNSNNERAMKRILKKLLNTFKVLPDIQAIQLEIEDIKNKLTTLRQTKENYGITDYHPKIEEVSRRIREEVGQLVWYMLEESRNCQIISIYGTSDTGRTILAEQLCKHGRVQAHFEVVARIDRHRDFSTRYVFKNLLWHFSKLSEAEKIDFRDMGERELAERVLNYLQNNVCLIVLEDVDDISSWEAWEKLRIAFESRNTNGKIVITTCSLEKAEKATAGKGLIHKMRNLREEEDVWQLVNPYVTATDYPELNAVDSEMDNSRRELETQHEGLTPNILAVGETSKIKYTSAQQWKIVNKNGVVSQETEKVQQALSLTYNGLSYQLKSCLFYLAIFSKDIDIKPEKLYHLWMAEGLLSSNNDQSETMMHMGEKYLDALHGRGMVNVQEEEVTSARKFKSCSLHNLICNFCLFMGRQEEVFVVMENELEQDSDLSFWTDRTWRLVINVGQRDNNKSLVRLNKKLRCLLVRGENQEADSHEMLCNIFNCLKQWRCLRILDFDGIDFGSKLLPKGIGDIVHLRYLSLMGCRLKKLPPSICKLPYLQILDLRVETGCEMEIPNVLRNMKSLRHLYLPPTFCTRDGVTLRLDGLTELETLENFNIEVCNVEDLSTLTKVRYLTVNAGGSLEDLKRLVEHMNNTLKLVLHSSLDVRNFDCYREVRHSVFRELLSCTTLHVLKVEGYLGQIPPYDKISENFTKIVLSGSELQLDPMPTLEMLPKLQALILFDDAFVGKKMTCSESRFPELKYLKLSNLHGLESWMIKEKAMPKLSTLVIENCSQLQMLPDGLQLTSLELKIRRMPETFKRWSVAKADEVPCETSIVSDNGTESVI